RHGAHTESTLRTERPGQAGAEVEVGVLEYSAPVRLVVEAASPSLCFGAIVTPVHHQEHVCIERRVRAALREREPSAPVLRLGDFPPGAHEPEIVRRLEADSRRAVITLEAREI